MEKLKQVFYLLLGFGLLGLAGWLTVWLLLQAGAWYEGTNDAVRTAIIAGVPLVVVALISFFASKSLETKRAIEQAMRPKKLELYTEFNEFFMKIFANEKIAKKPSEKEMTRFFAQKTPELMTFASNSVIEKWGKLRIGLDGAATNEEKMFLVEDLFSEIRADLGHGKRGFHKGDILRLFINDIDSYLKK